MVRTIGIGRGGMGGGRGGGYKGPGKPVYVQEIQGVPFFLTQSGLEWHRYDRPPRGECRACSLKGRGGQHHWHWECQEQTFQKTQWTDGGGATTSVAADDVPSSISAAQLSQSHSQASNPF